MRRAWSSANPTAIMAHWVFGDNNKDSTQRYPVRRQVPDKESRLDRDGQDLRRKAWPLIADDEYVLAYIMPLKLPHLA